jgi:hypothetical protein
VIAGPSVDGGIGDDDRKLLSQAAAFSEFSTLEDCTAPRLAELARARGLDLATAILYDRLLRAPEHGSFFRQVHTAEGLLEVEPLLVGIVPGAFYREHQNTGADGARIARLAESLNCTVEQIPLRSFGALAENASIIANWLRSRRGRRCLLVSLSKGGADLKVTLSLPNATELFDSVVAWVSLSGLVQGTPLVQWLGSQPLRQLGVRLLLRLRGHPYSVIDQLRHGPGTQLADWPALPERLRVIHVFGFPLRRHLAHSWAPRGYARLAPLGPNDGGGILLSDVARLPGTIFPVWGADHYLQPGWDTIPLLRRVFVAAMSAAGEFRQANQSASQPRTAPASKSSA